MSYPQDPYGPPNQPPGGQQQPPDPPGPQQPGWGRQAQWGGPPPGPAGSPSKSNLPLILGIVVVIALVVGGAAFVLLGEDDDESVTVAPDDLTIEDLAGLLLQPADVDPAFTETFRGEPTDTSDDLQGIPAECEAAMDEFEEGNDEDDISMEVVFGRTDEAEITHTVAPYRESDPSPSEVVASLREHCADPFEATDDEGRTFGVQIEAESVSGLGEAAFATTISLDHELFTETVEVYGLFVFEDGIVTRMNVSGGFEPPAPTDATLTPLPPDENLARELTELTLGRIRETG